MPYYSVNCLIAEMRKRKGISQAELAREICSISTVSKIENGLQMPSRKVCEGLLQRLGISGQNCVLLISDLDIQKGKLEKQIKNCLDSNGYEEAAQLLYKYEAMRQKNPENLLEKQFCLYVQGCLLQGQKRNPGMAKELFRRAICLSIPAFDPEHLEQIGLLTNDEIVILYRLAELIYELGNPIQGKRLLFFLKEYLENAQLEEEIRLQSYPAILMTLAGWMENDGCFSEELALSELGLSECVKGGRLTEYPMLLETKGYALLALDRVEEAANSLKQACIIFRSIGVPQRAEITKDKAKTLFQIHHHAAGQHQPL